MVRIFSLLSIVTIIMSLLAGIGVYWMSLSDVDQSNEKANFALAQGLASSVSTQINTLQKTVDKMAATKEAIAAALSNDPTMMAETALTLEQFMPEVMKIRILPPKPSELDQSSIPHMGNADLIMVQETAAGRQRPAVQGQGENRHLAMTAAIVRNNTTIGVVLVSLRYQFLQSFFKQKQFADLAVELKQQKTSLAKSTASTDDKLLDQQLKITGTDWELHYANSASRSLLSNLSALGIIFFPVLSIALAFFIAQRNLSNTLKHDQVTILKAFKDIMTGKVVGNYPVNLAEMKNLISTLLQYKRVLDNNGKDFSQTGDQSTQSDPFFEEPEGVSFLDMNLEMEETENESNSEMQIPSTPISLPETGQLDFPDLSEVSNTLSKEKKNLTTSIYKAYDIRGIVDQAIDQEIFFKIGQAIASEALDNKASTIVIGRDGRLSSPKLSESLAKGIISTGVNVLDVGLVPSPLVYFVAHHTEGKSAAVVTASHNPANYNGLKIIINGETLADERIQQIKQRVETGNIISSASEGNIDINNRFVNEYIGMISEDIHLVRPMKIVIDSGNGSTGEIAPTLLKTLGCEVIELFCEIDGNFPNHHPDPSDPKNLADLITAVKHYQADLGLAFDGDGDRLGVIDCNGKIIWADRQLMLYANDVLANKPGAEIIYDVKSSRHLQQHITKKGGRPLMWKTGHSYMKAKIRETGAALAAEMSGHIFFNDRWFGFDDALYAAARLIGILSADSRNSNEVFADLPDSICTPEIYLQVADGENTVLMEKLTAQANFQDADIITIDGLRVNFSDGWGLLRASNTLPALALRFEADNTEALKRIQTEFKQLLTQIKADIELPF